jgi:hypothetical protein
VMASSFSNAHVQLPLEYKQIAASTSAITYKTRIGGNTTTINFNGSASARKMGGVMVSFLEVSEIAA